jgi:GntR family transcriptional regulator of vanillate catabolism
MRMNEIDLAEALHVSRTPIRAALSILATEGLLRYTPNSGFVVVSFTPADIEAIYDVRSTLSGLAARLATHHGLSEGQVERMMVVIAKGQRLLDGADSAADIGQEWERLSVTFWGVIEEAARNAHLQAALQRTRDIPPIKDIRFRWISTEELVYSQMTRIAILDAIRAGQQLRAESLMREYTYDLGQRIVRQWRKIEARNRGAEAPPTDIGGQQLMPTRQPDPPLKVAYR